MGWFPWEVESWRDPPLLRTIPPLPDAFPLESSIPPLAERRVKEVVPIPPERRLMFVRFVVVSRVRVPAAIRSKVPALALDVLRRNAEASMRIDRKSTRLNSSHSQIS